MASTGANLIVTQDEELYNKLQRPADYLLSTAPPPPSFTTATGSTSRSSKRKHERDAAPHGKRRRVDHHAELPSGGGHIREPGMRMMLPGLDNDAEQLSDSSTSEAMAYLRSVRSEASTIPHLLVAQNSNQDDAHNQGSIYEDGVWIALDNAHQITHSDRDDEADLDPQRSYYNLLLKQFKSLRNKLAQAKANGIDKIIRASVEESNKTRWPRNKAAWFKSIDSEYPKLSQVIHMNEQVLFLGLQCCSLSLAKSSTISYTKSSWIWTLLALTGDMGTLNHELISRLRELGLQAGQLGERLRCNTSGHQDLSDDENGAKEEPSQNSNISQGNTEETLTDNPINTTLVREIEESQETPGVESEFAHMEQCKGNLNGSTNKSGVEMGISDEEAESSINTLLISNIEGGEGKSHIQPERVNEEQGKDSLHRDTSIVDGSMPMSSKEDRKLEKREIEDLEQARARLLAQLGDRLVQPRIPSSRAEAEWQRMQECRDQDMSSGPILAKERIDYDAGAQVNASADWDWNTRAAIDMILTVVVECYGQRDLLKCRQAW